MIRVLHTSDIHIGKVFEQFGSFGERLRGQIRETFRKILELAVTEHVDAVLLAGDVFDSGRIAQGDITFFMEAVNSVKPTPVYLLPGTWTHDNFLQKPIYRSRYFSAGKPENLEIFTKEEVETFETASGHLAIHGRAVLPDSGNPLDGMRIDSQAAYKIGLLHIAVSLPQIPEEPGMCVLKREHLEGCGLIYLALGDWHVFRRYFEDAETVVQYSGSPETLQFKDGEDSGFVALVTFGSSPPQVEKRRVGYYRWKELNLLWENVGSIEALKKQLAGLANPQAILRLTLGGTISEKQLFDLERLKEEFSPQFAYLEFDTAQLKGKLTLEELERTYRENTVERAFVTLVREALQNAGNEQEARGLREVLRRGHAVFQGFEEVVT
jgi:DNA repair exonuclease SbcCD nuclease subunit